MAVSLVVTIRNMCLIALGESDAEGWLMKDPLHQRVLDLKKESMRLPAALQGGADTFDLDGHVVSFGEGDPEHGGQMFGPARSSIGGQFIDYVADLEQISPGVRLADGWSIGDHTTLADGMAARLVLRGGTLLPREPSTRGGAKEWSIGALVRQSLTSQCDFVREVADTPFVRLHHVATSTVTDIPLVAENGRCQITLGPREVKKGATLTSEFGVVFVTEFAAFDQAVTLPDAAELPIPFTYWPDYIRQTDPEGGPCPPAVIDLREPAPISSLQMRRLRLR